VAASAAQGDSVTRRSIYDEELADTLADARRRRRKKAKPEPFTQLTRSLVGAPRPAPLGICVYCGTPAPNRSVCQAHDDLEELDGPTSAVVTRKTTGRSGTTTEVRTAAAKEES
jgi:hypothetical protein